MALEELNARLEVYKAKINRNRPFIIAVSLILGILLAIYAFTAPVFYTAHASFHPETGTNNSPSLAGSPLSFLLGSGGLDGDEAGMMEEVLKSRNLSEEVVKDTVSFEGEERLIADLVIEKFPKSISPIQLAKRLLSSGDERSYASKIILAGRFVRGSVIIEKEENGFLTMDLSFSDDSLTGILSSTYIEKLSNYYRKQKTEKARINLDFFTARADSIKGELDNAAQALARFQDRNKGLVFSSRMVSAKELEVKLEYLKEMYITLVTNREQAASQLQRVTPIIQVLDEPIPPFILSKKNPILFALIGLILGLIFTIGWLSRKLLWQDLMSYVKSSLENPPKEED
ncbi:MAG: Wzz/FepE/Etk N-terminal domain-containing protein [Bacteroidia bacterium]|nr:Wzz/FepE/Etk N-terminal domain-containing protein [Bacteroidia bacterium]